MFVNDQNYCKNYFIGVGKYIDFFRYLKLGNPLYSIAQLPNIRNKK